VVFNFFSIATVTSTAVVADDAVVVPVTATATVTVYLI
tara:strand:+ start:412 stop:525 length:114 start_codon:yes stop_codon:yes gene_type:complete